MQLSTERTRLHVDGVRAPITADVARRRDDGMIVMQPLPFLRLETPVTERGVRSRIRRVAIAMDGDVPRLLLELEHDRRDEDTIPSFTPGVSARPARTDSTVPYEFQARDEEPSASIVVSDPPPAPLAMTPRRRSWLARVWAGFVAALAAITNLTSS